MSAAPKRTINVRTKIEKWLVWAERTAMAAVALITVTATVAVIYMPLAAGLPWWALMLTLAFPTGALWRLRLQIPAARETLRIWHDARLRRLVAMAERRRKQRGEQRPSTPAGGSVERRRRADAEQAGAR